MDFMDVAGRRGLFFGKILQSKLTGKSWPLLVTWSLTHRCNFRCAYCYGDYQSRHEEPVVLKDALRLVEELADGGTQYIQLSGGEPLLYPGIEDVVDQANERGICLGMNTNGSMIPQRVEVIKKIKTVCVSLDGDESSNDANRGKGTWHKIMAGINTAQGAGARVHIYCTITRNNVDSLDWLLSFCRQKNIWAEFGLLVNRSLKNDADYEGIDLDIETFRQVQKKLVDYKKRGFPILFSRQVMERVQTWPDFSKKMWFGEPPFPYIRCHQGRLMLFIDCDGKVYPCLQMIGLFDGMDFREVGFARAYAHCQTHNCRACYLMCANDFNLLFDLNPGVIWNNVCITLKETLFHRHHSQPV